MRTTKACLITSISALLFACASGDDGGGIIEGTGESRPTIAVGQITGFGSVYVNGIQYHTDSANITFNEELGLDESALEIGMIITINGEVNDDGTTGIANNITFDRQLKGAISAIESTSSRTKHLTVLGISVEVNEDTRLSAIDFATLTVGNVINVSGLTDADGVLIASHIALVSNNAADNDEFEVEGNIASINTELGQLTIGNQTIDYNSAEFDGFTANDLIIGLKVEAEGPINNNVLVANELELKSDFSLITDREFELEGFISSPPSDNQFAVGEILIDYANATFVRGSEDNLIINQKVEIEGQFSNEGLLIADRIKIEINSNGKLFGSVDEIDLDNQQILILDQTISIDQKTNFNDDSEQDIKYFRLDDLSIGDWLEVKTYIADDQLFAQKITRKDADEGQEIEFRGVVESQTATDWVINNITVDITQLEVSELAGIEIGDTVEVEGSLIGPSIIQASEIELDDEENDDEEEEEEDVEEEDEDD